MEVFEAMSLRGEFPNIVTYNTMVDGLCRIGKMEEAMSLYKDMNCRGIYADNVTINPILKGLFHLKKIADAMGLFINMKRMEANGACGPDQVTYATMIDRLCKGHIDVAEELYLEIQGNSLSVDVVVCGFLIDGLCKQGQIGRDKEILSEMIYSGVSPSVIVYNSLINGLCKEGQLNEARELFLQIQNSGISPDFMGYNSLINGIYISGNEEAKTVLENMMGDGILSNVATFSVLEK